MQIERANGLGKTIGVALAAALASACLPANVREFPVETAMSAGATFAGYRTFAFGWAEDPAGGQAPSGRTLEVERHLRDVIASALRQRGYSEDAAAPSLVVRFAAGIDHVHSGGFEEDLVHPRDDEYVDFQIIRLDVFDASSKVAVYRGAAISQADLAKPVDDSLLRYEVQRLLASFPPRIAAADPPVATRIPALPKESL
jgi:Domain of unknown function (DUF4136)